MARHVRFGRLIATSVGLLLAAGCDAPSVTVADSPVPIVSETRGSGREAKPRDLVEINYRARTEDGEVVMEAKGYRFELAAGTVILGIDEGVRGMRVGGRRTLECRPHKHWGRKGYGTIPPNTTLLIDVELVAVD